MHQYKALGALFLWHFATSDDKKFILNFGNRHQEHILPIQWLLRRGHKEWHVGFG